MRGTFCVTPVEGVTKLTTFTGSTGPITGGVFRIDKPNSKADNPPQDIYAFIGVAASDKRLVSQMENITNPANLN